MAGKGSNNGAMVCRKAARPRADTPCHVPSVLANTLHPLGDFPGVGDIQAPAVVFAIWGNFSIFFVAPRGDRESLECGDCLSKVPEASLGVLGVPGNFRIGGKAWVASRLSATNLPRLFPLLVFRLPLRRVPGLVPLLLPRLLSGLLPRLPMRLLALRPWLTASPGSAPMLCSFDLGESGAFPSHPRSNVATSEISGSTGNSD